MQTQGSAAALQGRDPSRPHRHRQRICAAAQGRRGTVLKLLGVGLERQVCPRRAELGGGVGPDFRVGQCLVGAVRPVVPLDPVLAIGEDLLDAGREPFAFKQGVDGLVYLRAKFDSLLGKEWKRRITFRNVGAARTESKELTEYLLAGP